MNKLRNINFEIDLKWDVGFQIFEQPSEMVRIAICAQLTNICFYLWFDLDSWIFFKILILTRLAVLEGKAHMQLNLTFFPLPNFTEVILDQDIECRPQPPENDQNTNKVIY